MYSENATKLPPGIVQTDPAEDESSTWLTELGGRGTGYASWAWLRKKFGTPIDDYFKGHRLYLVVRPFDANSQWLTDLYQEFTPDSQKDAERYGFELMRDLPHVQGFWVEAYLDKYWHERRGRHDKPMLSRGRYERVPGHAPNARGTLEPGEHLETRPVLGGAYRGRQEDRATLTHAVVCDEQHREIRALCGQNVDHIADYYSISDEGRLGPPSCPRCYERWERLRSYTTNANLVRRHADTLVQIPSRLDQIQEGDVLVYTGVFADTRHLVRRVEQGPRGMVRVTLERLHDGQPDGYVHEIYRRGSSEGYIVERPTEHTPNAPLTQQQQGSMYGAKEQELARELVEAIAAGYQVPDEHLALAEQALVGAPAPVRLIVRKLRAGDWPSSTEIRRARSVVGGANANPRLQLESSQHPPLGLKGFTPNASLPMWLNSQQKELFAFFQGVTSASTADALRAVPGARSADVRRMHERGVLVSAPSPGRGNMLRLADQWVTGAHIPNASYYVWVLDASGNPMAEGPYGPHDLEGAKTFARISATEGDHDRAVSRGLDPESPSFEIVRRYRRGTGERVL
jgi:hypothetical protein